jgi:radical SAM superfamily enzyme
MTIPVDTKKLQLLHRLTGDGPNDFSKSLKWSAEKKHVLNMLNKAVAEA